MAVRWRIAILLAVITTINYIDRSVFGVVAPMIREQFGIGDADYGLITSGFLLAYGIGQLISGPLIDRLGTKRAFSLAAVFWSVATILHALGRGLWSFFTLRILLGLAEAANFPAASKAVAQWFPANERSTAVAIFMLGAGLGAIITPPLTVWTMQTLGWEWAFIIPGSLGLVWVFLWQRWYHLPETHPTIGPAEKALIMEQRSNQQSQGSWTALLSYREFWGILIARVVSDFPFYFFLFWLPQYLIDVRGFDLRAMVTLGCSRSWRAHRWLIEFGASHAGTHDQSRAENGYLAGCGIGRPRRDPCLLHCVERLGFGANLFWLVCYSGQRIGVLHPSYRSFPGGSCGDGLGCVWCGGKSGRQPVGFASRLPDSRSRL